jgi:hypothetical protein
MYLNTKIDTKNRAGLWITNNEEDGNLMKQKSTTEVNTERDMMIYWEERTADSEAI